MLKLSTGDQIEVFYIKDNFSSSGRPPIQYWVKKNFFGPKSAKNHFFANISLRTHFTKKLQE